MRLLPVLALIGLLASPALSAGEVTATWYGKSYAGKRTASGEVFDPRALTAAHPTLPFGSRVAVTNPEDGRRVVVRINDRGPAHGGIDLSEAAARAIGLHVSGRAEVELALIDGTEPKDLAAAPACVSGAWWC